MGAKTIVAVVVYDRFDNIEEWIRCYQMSENSSSELVVIHNLKNDDDIHICRAICLRESVKYVPRKNIGYDIGALQDVCRERLSGFPNDWDYLLWVTDDIIPMWKNFIRGFLSEVQKPNVGIACLEISKEVKLHIRTSGFIVSKEVSKRLTFPADPITTKTQCYEFEHRGTNTLIDQIKNMGKLAVQTSPTLMVSHLWDTDHRNYLNRWDDHYREFTKRTATEKSPVKPSVKLSQEASVALSKKVTFICPIYNTFPEIVSSLLLQTFDNWELYLIHDGKNSTGLKEYIDAIGDTRIIYSETPVRLGLWGFPIRRDALNQIKDGTLPKTDYIVITNADNYHSPLYVEKYLMEICKKPKDTIGAYCSKMIHNYVDYEIINCSLVRGYVDCASMMFKADVACDMGWTEIYQLSSDWIYIENIIKKYGSANIVKVQGCHLIHN